MSSGQEQPGQAGPPSPLAGHMLPAGTVVGERYRVRRQIGEGGMGAIYLAEHVELETSVALKILTTTRHSDSESVERFMREARAAVKIGHRNIVRIFDLGWLDESTPYMAMEFLSGRDLDDLLVEERWVPTDRCLEWMTQVASAIDMVHREGLVHRDIKPANIFLAEEHDELVPKLLDFGLAQLRERDAEKRLTRDGLIVGTPHYIAPEVGLGKDPNEASDLYSFAVVAYELLCGRLPFDHDNPTTLMLEKVQHDPPPLERTREGPVGPDVEAVFQKALSRDPAARQATCAEFIGELEHAFESTRSATDPCPPPVTEDVADAPALSERPPRRANTDTDTELVRAGLEGSGRRTAVVVALLLLALTVGVFVWAPWTGNEAALAESDVADPVTEAEPEEPAPADPEPADPEPTEIEPADPADTEAAEPDTAEEPAVEVDPPTRRRTRRDTSMSTDPVGMEEATAVTATMASMTESTMDTEPTELEREEARTRARELTEQAQTALIRGRLADAARLFRQATYHDARHAPAWRGLGISHERLGQRPEARRAYQRYLSLAGGAGDAAAIRRRMEALAP